jgi:hypothetical protein
MLTGVALFARTSEQPELRGSSWRVKWMGKTGEAVQEMRSYEPVLDLYNDGKWFLLYDQSNFRGGKYELSGQRLRTTNDDGTRFLTYEIEWSGSENRLILRSGKTIWRLEFRQKTKR